MNSLHDEANAMCSYPEKRNDNLMAKAEEPTKLNVILAELRKELERTTRDNKRLADSRAELEVRIKGLSESHDRLLENVRRMGAENIHLLEQLGQQDKVINDLRESNKRLVAELDCYKNSGVAGSNQAAAVAQQQRQGTLSGAALQAGNAFRPQLGPDTMLVQQEQFQLLVTTMRDHNMCSNVVGFNSRAKAESVLTALRERTGDGYHIHTIPLYQ